MQVLGVQIDRPYLRAALINRRRGGVEIRALKIGPLSDPKDVKLLYMPRFKGQIISAFSAKDLLIRPIAIKIGKSQFIEEALAFQAEASSYFNPADVISVPYLLKKSAKETEALLFTASREALKIHLQELRQLECDPDQIDATPLALTRYIKWRSPALLDAFIVDLGSSEWTCIWMEGGEVKKSHSILGGIEALYLAFWEDRKKILLQKELEGVAKQTDLMKVKSPHFVAKFNELQRELSKVLFSFHRLDQEKPLVFTGRVDAFIHLRNALIENVKDAISSECTNSFPLEEVKYAIPIGLALGSPLQLLREEFFPSKNWKRTGRITLLLFLASFLLSSALLIIGKNRIKMRENRMVALLQTSLNRWDPKLEKTIFSKSSDPEEILDQWITSVDSHGKEYAYLLTVPKVCDVLSWLSQHPLLESFKTEGDPIDIRDIRYQLVNFPKIGSQREPYKAKVEVEFRVQSPMNARMFHDALIQGDELVDAQSDVSWEALHEGYRVSFFLKNLRPYVL